MSFHPETLKTIQQTAVRAADAKFVDVPGDPRLSLLIHGDQRETFKKPAPLRKHTVAELSELCRFIRDYKPATEATVNGVAAVPVVFHSAEQIAVLLDDSDRRETVSLKLAFTSVWQWAAAVAQSPKSYDARGLLTLLKTALADAVPPEQLHNFQTALRSVKFVNRDETTVDTATKGAEALGRSIEQQCTGGGDVPDLLTLRTNIYRNATTFGELVEIAFVVSIDYDAQKFVITAIGDRIAEAVDGAQQLIGAHIRNEAQIERVYYGTP